MATKKITTDEIPSLFDATDSLSKDEILEQENNLLSNLLELAHRREDALFHRKVEILGKDSRVKATFRLRPLSSLDVEDCVKQATKLVKTTKGKVDKELNQRLFQSILIYTATVEADQKAVWGNIPLKKALNILDNFDMVDALLLAGEKASVLAIIDEMGGFSQEGVTTAKN